MKFSINVLRNSICVKCGVHLKVRTRTMIGVLSDAMDSADLIDQSRSTYLHCAACLRPVARQGPSHFFLLQKS